MKSDLHKQVESARRHVWQLKRVTPYIFPEYNEMCYAKQDLQLAKARYEAAKLAWRQLAQPRSRK